MEDATVALALALLEEGDLVAQAKLYVLGNVEVSLAGSMQIEVVPYATFQAKAEIMKSLFIARTA